jgi:heptosyltransferase-2
MKIAIIKIGALGDVLRTTCLLAPLHERTSDAEIWWYTAKGARPLLDRNPWLARVVDARETPPAGEPRFDLVISLDEETDAAALAGRICGGKLVGAHVRGDGSVGYTADSAAWFEMGLLNRDADGGLTAANALKRANRATYPNLLFAMLGLTGLPSATGKPLLVPSPEEEAWAGAFAAEKGIDRGRPVIGLNTGSGSRWTSKQLSIEKTVELVDRLAAPVKEPLLLLGGPEEVERNRTLVRRAGGKLVDGGTGNSLPRFISLVNLCDTVITSDSLALHIATALDKRVVVFFGPTSATEIPLFGNSVRWTSTAPCACFYAARCTADRFCLDTLDCDFVADLFSRPV